jgi:hypothetical protein
MTSSPTPRDLLFDGTVLEIRPVEGPNPRLRWAVTTKVDRVIGGAFEEETFSFFIHSPTKSGLEVGGAYRVRATWTGNGYTVEEHQWRHGSH